MVCASRKTKRHCHKAAAGARLSLAIVNGLSGDLYHLGMDEDDEEQSTMDIMMLLLLILLQRSRHGDQQDRTGYAPRRSTHVSQRKFSVVVGDYFQSDFFFKRYFRMP
jgi:hypothetical protein